MINKPVVMATNKIIFIHLPKTGGQSIRSALSMEFDHIYLDNSTYIAHNPTYEFYHGTVQQARRNKEVCLTASNAIGNMLMRYCRFTTQETNEVFRCEKTSELIDTLVQTVKEKHPEQVYVKPNYKFICIHDWITWNPFNDLVFKENDFTFTIIREPISLFYSIYHYLIDGLSKNKDVDKTITHFGVHHKMISQSKDIKQYIDWVLDFGYIIKRYILPVGYFNDKMLSSLKFVGIYEYFNESIRVLEDKIQRKLDVPFHNVNVYNKDYEYKYNELSEFFSDEITIYNKYKTFFEKQHIKK